LFDTFAKEALNSCFVARAENFRKAYLEIVINLKKLVEIENNLF